MAIGKSTGVIESLHHRSSVRVLTIIHIVLSITLIHNRIDLTVAIHFSSIVLILCSVLTSSLPVQMVAQFDAHAY
jgi:hypothetical protein